MASVDRRSPPFQILPVARSGLEVSAQVELVRRQMMGTMLVSSADLGSDLLHVGGRPLTPASLTGFDRPVMVGVETIAHHEVADTLAQQLIQHLRDFRPLSPASSEDELSLRPFEEMQAEGSDVPGYYTTQRRANQYPRQPARVRPRGPRPSHLPAGRSGRSRSRTRPTRAETGQQAVREGDGVVAHVHGGPVLVRTGSRPRNRRHRDNCARTSRRCAPHRPSTRQLGVRRWAEIALREAVHELQTETREFEDRRRALFLKTSENSVWGDWETLARPLYLLDEPEAHLHPVAQREAAAWVVERARGGAEFVVATHAPSFLNIRYEATSYVRVHRDAQGITRATAIDESAPGALREDARSAGYGSIAELFQLTRAVLVVEEPMTSSSCPRWPAANSARLASTSSQSWAPITPNLLQRSIC